MDMSKQGKFDAFIKDEAGATAIEYALIGSLISVVIVASLLALNDSMTDMYEYVRSFLVPAMGG